MTTEDAASAGVFALEQTYEAPAALVYRAWTNADELARWWGPEGMTIHVIEADIRVGGSLHYAMGAGDFVMWGRFSFLELVPGERIVFVDSMIDEAGAPARMPHASEFPTRLLTTVTLKEADGRTTVRLTVTPFEATAAELAAFDGMKHSIGGGYRGALGKLAGYLAVR